MAKGARKMNKISWNVPVGNRGFNDVILTNTQISADVNEATEVVYYSIVDGFNLSKNARNGIAERMGGLKAMYREGDRLEEDVIQMPLGSLALSNVSSLTKKQHDYRALPSTIFLTSASFKEEIENLHTAADEFSRETANDDNSTGFEHGIAAFALDHDAIASEAVKLAISRRMLKYGVLPSAILSPELAETVGFETWFQEKIAEQVGFGDLSKKRKNEILDSSKAMYSKNSIATRNLRKSVWPKTFRKFLPFDADTNQIFFTYYLNKVVSNSENTLVFSDELTVRLSDAETADTLEKVYAPSSFSLRSV